MTMNHKELDEQYSSLFKKDKQLQFAANAINHYKIDKTTHTIQNDLHYYKEKGHIRTHNSNIKRHILNIDNTSRINYEMIKNIPGNIPVGNTIISSSNNSNNNEDEDGNNAAEDGNNDNDNDNDGDGDDDDDDDDENMNSKKRTLDLIDIDIVKTKIFKNNLFEMNDSFINKLPKFENDTPEEETSATLQLPLNEQLDSLYQLQHGLLNQYSLLQNLEKKWFALREINLDANIELDLFSEQDVKSLPIDNEQDVKSLPIDDEKDRVKVRLGSINVPASHTQSAIHTLAFNRCKRLRNNKESNNIIVVD